MYKRVLVPLDGSTTALQVFPYAELVAKSSGATIELLQALTAYPSEMLKRVSHQYVGGGGSPSYPPSIEMWTSIQNKMRDDVKARLEAVAVPLRANGLQGGDDSSRRRCRGGHHGRCRPGSGHTNRHLHARPLWRRSLVAWQRHGQGGASQPRIGTGGALGGRRLARPPR